MAKVFDMRFLPMAALLAGRVVAQSFTADYDEIAAGGPGLLGLLGLLSDSLDGVGVPISNPYHGLTYSSGWLVAKLQSELVQQLDAPSVPNVLVSANATIGKVAGTLTKTAQSQSFNVSNLSFACASENILGTVPVSCSILFIGTSNSASNDGDEQINILNYPGSANFTVAQLDFTGLDQLSFTLVDAVANDGSSLTGAAMLVDSVEYDVE